MKKFTLQNPAFKVLVMALLMLVSCAPSATQPQTPEENNATVKSLDYKTANVYLTAKNTSNRLANTQQLPLNLKAPEPDENFPVIILDPAKTFQTIVGFGGALTDAAAETFYKLPTERQQEILTAYFDRDKGIGYSLCRTHINSCDFSSSSYAYTEVENDTLLSNFSIDKDKEFRIPFIKKAVKAAGNQLALFASPWSPPAWMKNNNDMLHGGKLLPQYYRVWANYYVSFMKAYKNEGIPFWGLTVQNEPMATQTWESCIYTAAEERDFVKNFLGPALVKSEFKDTKLMIWDHNRGVMYQRAQTVYDDKDAAKYVWGTGFHWYVGDHFDNVKRVKEAWPDKNLLFTEGCNYPFNLDSLNEWHWGENYGRSVVNDLNNGANGWVDWNVLLDETGGPNHVNNFCMAPVIGDTRNGQVHYMNSFYYLGHFSKFIRPGAKRIICSTNDDDFLATAFMNPDGTIATVVLNLTGKDKNFQVWMDNKSVNTLSPAHSIITVVLK
jgi:glucosylceramidase